MELRHPPLRIRFAHDLGAYASPAFRKLAYGGKEDEYRLRCEVESLVEDVLNFEDLEIVGSWCYDLAEVRLVRDVEEALHATLSGDWHSGDLVEPGSTVWDRLAWAATMAYLGLSQRGFPPCDPYPGTPIQEPTDAFVQGGFLARRDHLPNPFTMDARL